MGCSFRKVFSASSSFENASSGCMFATSCSNAVGFFRRGFSGTCEIAGTFP